MELDDLLLPTFTQMLTALRGWLDKAEQAGVGDAVMAARLAPDMYPLANQVRFACFLSLQPLAMLRGEPLSEERAALREAGMAADRAPSGVAAARDCVTRTLVWLEAGRNDLAGAAMRRVTVTTADGRVFEMSGTAFARDWALPQFYFHLNAAYAILRAEGLDLGKADYVKHMAAHAVLAARG